MGCRQSPTYDDTDVPLDNLLLHSNCLLTSRDPFYRTVDSFRSPYEIDDDVEENVHYQDELVYYLHHTVIMFHLSNCVCFVEILVKFG